MEEAQVIAMDALVANCGRGGSEEPYRGIGGTSRDANQGLRYQIRRLQEFGPAIPRPGHGQVCAVHDLHAIRTPARYSPLAIASRRRRGWRRYGKRSKCRPCHKPLRQNRGPDSANDTRTKSCPPWRMARRGKINAMFTAVETAPAQGAEWQSVRSHAEAISRFQAALRDNVRSESTIASYLNHLRAALRGPSSRESSARCPRSNAPSGPRTGVAAKSKGRAITGEEFDRMLATSPRSYGSGGSYNGSQRRKSTAGPANASTRPGPTDSPGGVCPDRRRIAGTTT